MHFKLLISIILSSYTTSLTAVSEDSFHKTTDKIVNHYRPLVRSYGANLIVKKDWQNPNQNATAWRATSTRWELTVNGGLAKHPLVTDDAFSLIICHEMGHFFGGFPTTFVSIAACEGQADYYASQVCLRNVWRKEPIINARFRNGIHPTAKLKCDTVWNTTEDQNLCYRILNAAYEAGKHNQTFFPQDEPRPISFDERSPRVVSSTTLFHTHSQCRFDTGIAGALCNTEFDESRLHTTQADALANSCDDTDTLGQRPRCWFKEQ